MSRFRCSRQVLGTAAPFLAALQGDFWAIRLAAVTAKQSPPRSVQQPARSSVTACLHAHLAIGRFNGAAQ